jgi:alanine racemase
MKAPIIGRISMDLCAVDVSEVVAQKGASACAVGTDATLIGQDGESSQSAYDLARLCDTIPYEILTSINARVARYTL